MSRVAIVDLAFHWPSNAGSVVHTCEVARLLSRHGHDVRLFTVEMPDRMPRGQIAAPLPCDIRVAQISRDAYTPANVAGRMRELVAIFQPDVVLIGEGWSMKLHAADALADEFPTLLRFYAQELLCPFATGFSQMLADRACGSDVVRDAAKCQSCYDHAYPIAERAARIESQDSITVLETERSGYFTVAYQSKLRSVLRRVACCLPQNQRFAARLGELGARTHVIPPGIDLAAWPVQSARANAVTRFFLPGRIDQPYKGLSLLRAAVAILGTRRTDFEVLVTAEETGELTPHIASVGLRPRDAMPKLYGDADVVLVLPLLHEALPLVGIEALASGRPIIGTDMGGMPDLVGDAPCGELIAHDDPAALAAAMERMIVDPPRRTAMGAAARRRAERAFDWERVYADHYESLIDEVAQTRRWNTVQPAFAAAAAQGALH